MTTKSNSPENMTEAPQQASDLTRQTPREQLARESFEPRASTGSGEAALETNRSSIIGPEADWRQSFAQASGDAQRLQAGNLSDAERQQLSSRVDAGYQNALPVLQQQAAGADNKVLLDVANYRNADQASQQALLDPAVRQALYPDGHGQLTSDAITNARLNYANRSGADQSAIDGDSTYAKLNQLAAADETKTFAQQDGGDALLAKQAQLLGAADYGSFVAQNHGGVVQDSSDPTGQSYLTSRQILDAAKSPEALATPVYRTAQTHTENAALQAQEKLLPKDNPILTMAQATQIGQADPKKATELYHSAVRQAEQLQLDQLKNKAGDDPLLKQAYDDLTHAKPTAQMYLGWNMLRQENPDYAGARQLLQDAMGDKTAVEKFTNERGQPLVPQLMQSALTEGKSEKPDYQNAVQTVQKDFQTYQDQQKSVSEIQEKLKNAKDDEKPKLEEQLGKANDAGKQALEDAVTKGDALRHMYNGKSVEDLSKQLKDESDKPDGQKNQDKIDNLKSSLDVYHLQSQARLTLAIQDTSTNDTRAAEDLMKKIKADDPSYFDDPKVGEQLKSSIGFDQQGYLDHLHEHNKCAVQKVAEFGAGLFTGKSEVKAFKFAVEHPKLAAELVATAVAATAVTVATGGMGAPLAVGIAAGIGTGALAGTAAGGLATAADSKMNHKGGSFGSNFVDGMRDTAGSAVVGSTIGALTAGVGSPAVAGGKAAAEVGGAAIGDSAGTAAAGQAGSKLAAEAGEELSGGVGKKGLGRMAADAVRAKPADNAFKPWMPEPLRDGGSWSNAINSKLSFKIPEAMPKIGGSPIEVGKMGTGMIRTVPRMGIIGGGAGVASESAKVSDDWNYYKQHPGEIAKGFVTSGIREGLSGAGSLTPYFYVGLDRSMPQLLDRSNARPEYAPIDYVPPDEESPEKRK